MATVETPGVLGTFHGSEEFPIDWQEGERELFWIYDDLHCPNPVSPLFFDIGGWWLTCDHMFRRFGTPFASDWIAKRINGYVYTAAIPADPSVRAEATEYQARYVPRVPRDGEYAGAIGAYLGFVLPHYAETSSTGGRTGCVPRSSATSPTSTARTGTTRRSPSWRSCSRTRSTSTIATGRSTGCSTSRSSRRRWRSTPPSSRRAARAEPELLGRLQSSVEDRNWDSIEDLWKMKEEIKADDELRAAFDGADTARGVIAALEGSERGRRFIAERLRPHQQSFGYKAIWSHEFAFKTWVEDPAPIIEAVRGYLATDYDYPANIQSVRDDLEKAKAEVMDGVEGEQRARAAGGAGPVAGDEPADARPPLLHRPGHERAPAPGGHRDRPQADRGGRARRRRGRRLPALQRGPPAARRPVGARRVQELVSDRRDEHEDARRAPPAVVGRHGDRGGARVPVRVAVGLPGEVPRRRAGDRPARSRASPPRPAWSRAPPATSPRSTSSTRSSEGDILVCRMTNPAWVVLFTKIRGLVTEAGGTMSHPAVVAREFGIPAVVGTTNAGDRIKTGDRVRVNGTTGDRGDAGVSHAGDRVARALVARGRRSRCAPSAATRRRSSPAGRSSGS